MRGYTFEEMIGGYHFHFELLTLKNKEHVFFITSDMKNERSFFMSKLNDDRWIILYHNLLGREILKLEPKLFEEIRKRGY